mgnify:FL=1
MKIEIENSTGNVYADLGLSDSSEMKVKAGLARAIAAAIKARGLTQAEAAERMGLPQPKVSGILRGVFRGVSVEKMMECLQGLGLDVHISVGPAKRPEHAEILVLA